MKDNDTKVFENYLQQLQEEHHELIVLLKKSFLIKREVRSESKFGIILRTNRIKKLIIKGHTLYTWNFYYDIKYMHSLHLNLSRRLKVFRIYHLSLHIFANVCSQLRVQLLHRSLRQVAINFDYVCSGKRFDYAEEFPENITQSIQRSV